MATTQKIVITFSALLSFLLFSCTPQQGETIPATSLGVQLEDSAPVDMQFTIQTIAGNGKLLYRGVGGDIDGVVNPDLVVKPGSVVHITLINGDGMTHDLFLPDFNVKTEYVSKIGNQAEITFATGNMQLGSYAYYCTLPGHRQAGQEGKLIIEEN